MKISRGAKAFARDASESTIGNLSSNTRHCTPLECGREEESCSIDISQDLLSRSLFSRLIHWSENHSTKKRFFKTCHRAKNKCYVLKELYRQG